MSIYDDLIRRKEENNVRLEQSADRALLENERLIRIENEMDDEQSALLCILERFGLFSDRLYGFHSIPNLLDSMLDPLGIMYEYTEDLSSHTKSRSSNILAFREDGAAVALMPEPSGYRYYCPSDASKGLVSKAYVARLRSEGYVLTKPFLMKKSVLRAFAYNTLSCLTSRDILRLLIASLLTTALGLVIPAVSKWVYKSYIAGTSPALSGLLSAATIYILVVFAQGVITLIKSLTLTATKLRVSVEMQSMVMATLPFPSRTPAVSLVGSDRGFFWPAPS